MYSNEQKTGVEQLLSQSSQSNIFESSQEAKAKVEYVAETPEEYVAKAEELLKDILTQPDEELSVFPATLDTLQKEVIDIKKVVTVFGNYLKKVEHVLNFHNDHIKRLVLKDAENVGKEIGADMNPPEPKEKPVYDESKVIKSFSSPIKELTEENMVPDNTAIVMLYTHTCPHCINLKPIYEKMAPLLVQEGIQVCAINVAHQRKAAIEYQVKGVPSIRLIHNSTKHEYKGRRSEEEIMNWIQTIINP